MNVFPARSTAAAALLACLAGCAGEATRYPSLALRPVEKRGFAEPEVVPVVAAPDPALDATIATLSANFDRIAREFERAATTAQRAAAAAKGKPAGSEPWITAQTELAGLDDLRAQTSAAIIDIDQAGIDRAATLAPDYPALAALKEKAQATADSQSATIARIQNGLAPA